MSALSLISTTTIASDDEALEPLISVVLPEVRLARPPAVPSDEPIELLHLVNQLNTIAYIYIMPIFISTSIFTNVINIYVLHDLGKVKDKRQRGSQTTYMYLNWLSVAQLLACLSIIPSLINLQRENLSYGWAFYYAHFEIFSTNCLTSTCVYIVVGLSVDRFVAVCRPHSYQTLSRVRHSIIRIIASFLVPPLIYAPLCFFQKVKKNDEDTGYIPIDNPDMTEHRFWIFWNVAVEFCHRLIPAIFIVVLNTCIILKFRKIRNSSCRTSLNKSNNEHKNTNKSQLNSKSSATKVSTHEHETKMFTLLMGVIIVFLVTTLPSACLGLTDTFGHKYYSLDFEIFRAIANLLEVLGFSFNFFLYFFLVPEVREKLETLLSKSK